MSAPARSAAVVAVGDELVAGDVADRNSSWLAQRLGEHGFEVQEARLVGDDEGRIAAAVVDLAARHALVLVTGGLGPTLDDVTRHAVARAAGRELRVDAAALEEVAAFWRERERPMPASNERQALLPAGAELLPNRAGTAPGFRVALGAAHVAVLPGPPREMRVVFDESLAPWLASLPASTAVLRRRRLSLFGLSESEFADRVGELMERARNPRIGVLAREGLLAVKLEARASDPAAADALLAAGLDALRQRVERWLFSDDDLPPEEVVGRALLAAGVTVATAESCTGGLVAERLTRVAGISAVFLEGFVTYSNRAKVERLGVDPALLQEHGAVSEPVAAAMARGAAERAGARLAVATTGVAGPGGGTPEKPVGTVCFGVCLDGRTASSTRRFPPRGRAVVRSWAANAALALLRAALRADPGATPDG